ncbi:hypothetical protein GQ42DRAFT_162595 [Ramicandelaber brevisporus]|nr:hypothetical protein GQ42DRAFT_162595 [Ramicandelaber brevisporus]
MTGTAAPVSRVQFTVGKMDAGMAILLTEDNHLIEFPSLLLPKGITAGSVVTISVDRDRLQENSRRRDFFDLQDDILREFGQHKPANPTLQVRSVTQTAVVIEWDPLELHQTQLMKIVLYKNGQRTAQQIPLPSQEHLKSGSVGNGSGIAAGLGSAHYHLPKSIAVQPQAVQVSSPSPSTVGSQRAVSPAVNHRSSILSVTGMLGSLSQNALLTPNTAKISGLDVDHEYEFRIEIHTTAGVFTSNTVRTRTHTLKNLQGINVCFGERESEDEVAKLKECLNRLGAKWTENITVDTTHLLTRHAGGPKFAIARACNTPIVAPDWLMDSESQGRLQPALAYYIAS